MCALCVSVHHVPCRGHRTVFESALSFNCLGWSPASEGCQTWAKHFSWLIHRTRSLPHPWAEGKTGNEKGRCSLLFAVVGAFVLDFICLFVYLESLTLQLKLSSNSWQSCALASESWNYRSRTSHPANKQTRCSRCVQVTSMICEPLRAI